MNSTSNFQIKRIGNLIRYEWVNRKKMYVAAIFGMIALLIFFFQFFFYSNIGSMRWESGYYHGVFIIGLFILSFLAVGQSFLDLREKKSARLYLTLPASHLEKYTVQFLMRVFLPLVCYPLLFWVASILSVELFKLGDLIFSYSSESSNPEVAQLGDLLKLPEFQISVVYWLAVGLLFMILSLMFSGGVFFGKWNFILMPLTVLFVYGIMAVSTIGLLWLLKPDSIQWEEQIKFDLPNIDAPEVFPDVPLLMFVSAILIWLVAILSYVASYFKLTEKEV
ncbi:MAG: hypothetical protein P8O16_10685 [Algoriphagus sp.]|uniref:hypothetical protein n=1 Tax=Algoriphagus sp. TaxID=1872435 RepID=UPI0026226872|nr:hypothetical protein [Algoriphagus sp.]MDG1277739.1 hypothetical protein [Algoriphagus sp.]